MEQTYGSTKSTHRLTVAPPRIHICVSSYVISMPLTDFPLTDLGDRRVACQNDIECAHLTYQTGQFVRERVAWSKPIGSYSDSKFTNERWPIQMIESINVA